jgi:hypothetical protein
LPRVSEMNDRRSAAIDTSRRIGRHVARAGACRWQMSSTIVVIRTSFVANHRLPSAGKNIAGGDVLTNRARIVDDLCRNEPRQDKTRHISRAKANQCLSTAHQELFSCSFADHRCAAVPCPASPSTSLIVDTNDLVLPIGSSRRQSTGD